MEERFRVARNPDAESRLPYLVWRPIEGGLVLKAREIWPRASRVFCSHEGTPWDESAGVVDEAQILLCRRRGAAIDLVLDRTKLARSQFVFTNARGRPAVWWQTQQTAQFANPGARVPPGTVKGGNTLSNSRELVIAAVNVTLPDASADIPHLLQRPYCLPLSA